MPPPTIRTRKRSGVESEVDVDGGGLMAICQDILGVRKKNKGFLMEKGETEARRCDGGLRSELIVVLAR